MPRHIAVTIVATTSRMGGAATYLREVVPAWRASFPEDVLTIVGPDDVRDRPLERVTRFVQPGPWERSDVCIYAGNFLPLRERRPTVLLVRNPLYFSDQHRLRLRRQVGRRATLRLATQRSLCLLSIRRATIACAPSLAMKKQIEAFDPDAGSRMVVVPHLAFGVPPLAPDSRRVDFVYVTLPALHKNYAVLVRAAAALRGRDWDGSLHLVGADNHDDVATARHLAKRLSIEDAITWHEPRETGDELYSLAPVCLIPSLEESFGFTYHEALAHATRIVAADISIARERLRRDDRVVFADAEDWMQWADAMTRSANACAGVEEQELVESWSATAARLREACELAISLGRSGPEQLRC